MPVIMKLTRPDLQYRRPYLLALLSLLLLFCLRVAGQFIVALFHPQFLPPMHLWHSGILPYPLLLQFQLAIIFLYSKICLDFAGIGGKLARARQDLAVILTRLGGLYFAAMLLRFACLYYLQPEKLVPDGMIPTFFHFVLASYILVLAQYHHSASKLESGSPPTISDFNQVPMQSRKKEFIYA